MYQEEHLARQRYWAEIDLDHLAHNYRQVQNMAPGQRLICVVKANAYGLGAVPIAQRLMAEGASYFGVGCVEEALQLRRQGITADILIMGTVSPAWIPELVKQQIAVAIGDLEMAVKTAAQVPAGQRLRIHVAIETGMNRIGFQPEQALAQVQALTQYPQLEPEGVFSHMAAADDPLELAFSHQQIRLFDQVLAELKQAGLLPPLRHLANSSALIRFGADLQQLLSTQLTAARPGGVLFGINPVPDRQPELKPLVSLRTRVTKIKQVEPGQSLGYNRSWYTQRPSRIATLSAGYADGLLRSVSNRLSVLWQGQRIPQAGWMCMDQCMIDVTDFPGIQVGDCVTVVGRDGGAEITLADLAETAGLIQAEMIIAIGQRVPRLYYQQGQLQQLSYLEGGLLQAPLRPRSD